MLQGAHEMTWAKGFLFLALALGCFIPAARAATYSGGGGTSGSPYLISTSADLLTLSSTSADWSMQFLMTSDIDMTGVTTFTPIGNATTKFTGVFDGGGHRVRDLTIDLPTQGSVGFFGYVDGESARIRDLGIESATVTGRGSVGGLAGQVRNGATVTSCYATGSVTGEGGVGGLVGQSFLGVVISSYAMNTLTATESIGGLVGINAGTVTACYATGAVTGESRVGGLAGTLGGSNPLVSGSFWNVETSGQLGSAGGKGLTTAQMKTLAVFRNAGWGTYAWAMQDGQYPRLAWEGTGAPNIPDPEPLPLIGSGTEADPYIVGTPQEFALLSWRTVVLNAHIRLTADLDCAGVGLHPIGDLGSFGGVFDGGGHSIRNAAIQQPGGNPVGLFAILDLNGAIRNLGLDNITVIGDKFVGALVGLNRGGTVTSCYVEGTVTGTGEHVGGLIGCTEAGSSLTNCHALGTVTSTNQISPFGIGGLVGGNSGTVTDCYTSNGVVGGWYVGGLCGISAGTVTSCHATGTVSGTYTGETNVGGLVGINGGTLANCYATGTVEGPSHAGGLVGFNGGTLTACYATGTVSCSGDYAGGLVGYYDYGILTSSYATGSVNGTRYVGGLAGQASRGTVTKCYATGPVTGVSNLGGLVGILGSEGAVASCFWDRETGGPDNGLGIGLSTAQMRQRATFETAGWDFAGLPPAWAMVEGQMYPYLFGIPTPIESVGALYALATTGTGTFFLTHDLDARDTANWTAKSTQPGFLPIGTPLQPFNGTLDGNGHRIYGLHIYRPGLDGVGLFGYIGSSGVVRELGLDDVDIMGGSNTGGLVGVNRGTIQQCYVRGSVSGTGAVAGLAGQNGGPVDESYAAAALSGSLIGGLVAIDIGGTCVSSFWDTTLSGAALSAGGTGLSTPAMRSSLTYASAGWDMANTWSIAEGMSYPYFLNSLLLRVVSRPPTLINADTVDIAVEAFVPNVFVTVGGGAYPAYRKFLTASQGAISVSLKQEAINQLIVSAVSETGEETVVARYLVYESAQFPSTPTAVTSLALRPTSVSLAQNATRQFMCAAAFADGTTGDVTPITNWNISGGAITSAGLYTHSSGTVTIQALLHTSQGWTNSNVATVTAAKGGSDSKSSFGQVGGLVRSTYTGLGMPSGRVTAYNIFNPTSAGQYPVYDTLGNYSFFMPEGVYHFEGACPGHRSEVLWGGQLLERSELTNPGPPPQYSEPQYSGRIHDGRPLTHDFSLRPNDTGAPWVVFIEPVANTTVKTSNIVVTAIDADQYSELGVAKYTHNTVDYDIPNKISSTGFYRDTWTLKLGLNVLHLYTMDTEGNASEKTIQITYDPNYNTPGGDTDGDGMPNAWETAHGLSASSAVGIDGAEGDLDGDGLTNLEEYQRGTLPNSVRSDLDDLTDAFEVRLGTNPLLADTDGDGVNDDVEWAQGSDPLRDDRIKMQVVNLPDGGSVHGNAVTLLADVLPGYNLGAVASVAFEVMGTGTGNVWRAAGTAAGGPFVTTWDASSYPEGAYQVRAVATSRIGCVDGAPTTISVTIASGAPYYERMESGVHTLTAPMSASSDTVLALRAGARFARITIPAGAIAANDTLTALFPDATAFHPTLSTFQQDAGLYLDIHLATHTGDFLNAKRAKLELSYPDTDRDDHLDDTDLRVSLLSVNYLAMPTSVFAPLVAPGLDRTTGCIMAETPHFSVFGVIEEQPAAPLNLMTDRLPSATVGAPYAATLEANGGAPPYTGTVTEGALPDGLSIVGTSLQGTPAAPGAFAFTLRVSDGQSIPYTATRSYTVSVSAANQPSVTVTRATGQAGLANTLPARWNMVFSEAVTGFSASGVALGGTASYGAVFDVTGSGDAYVLSVSGVARDGTLHPTVVANAATSALTSAPNRASENEEEVWVDRKKPQVLITFSAAGLQEYGDTGPLVVKTLPVAFTLTFDEPVTGLAAAGITFAGLSPQPTFGVYGAGKNYTILVTGATENATLTPSLNANATVDSVGNGVLATAYSGRAIQYVPEPRPTVTINQAASQADPTNVFPIVYNITFSLPMTGFDTGDMAYSGTAPNPQYTVSGTGAAYTLTVTGTSGDGRIAFYVPENVTAEGNAPSTSTDNVVIYYSSPPSALITSIASNPTRISPIVVSVAFNENVTGFGAAGITATNATVDGFNGRGANYSFCLMPLNQGTVSTHVNGGACTNTAGCPNTMSAALTRTYDTFAPTLTINQAAAQADPANALPMVFDVVFSESVTGFDAADVMQTGTATGVAFTVTQADASHYTVRAIEVAGDGTVIPAIATGRCTDLAGNTNEASTSTDNSVTYDTERPTVTVNQAAAQGDPTKELPITFDVVFSEAVTGFDAADVAQSGAATGVIFDVNGSDDTYTLTATAVTGDGAIIPIIAPHACTDLAGNTNTVSTATDNSVAYDTTAPEFTNIAAAPSPAGLNAPVAITFTASEILAARPTVTVNGRPAAFSGQEDDTYTHMYTVLAADANGPATISISADDAAGNTGTTLNATVFVVDNTKPTANFSAAPRSGQPPLEVQFTDGSTAVPGTPINGWSWNFGDGTPPVTGLSPAPHAYAAAGVYPVTLTVTDAALNSDTEAKAGYIVVGGPTAAFIATPITGYAPLPVQFTDQSDPGASPITGWQWQFGDGANSTASNPVHTYAAPGDYGVILTVTNAVTSDTQTRHNYIHVAPGVPPTADFRAKPTDGAAPLTVRFTDLTAPGTSPINDWFWNFGDGETSHEQHPKHVYTAPGEYTVALTVTTVAGEDLFTREDYIKVDVAIPALNWMGLALLAALLALVGFLFLRKTVSGY